MTLQCSAPRAGLTPTESAPSSATSAETDNLNVAPRPSRRPLLLAALAGCVVASAFYGISYFRGRPDPIRKIFAEQIPRWQLRRAKGWIPTGGTELLALQSALRRYPEVSLALGRLDDGKVQIEKTDSFVFSDAWFESLWPLSSLQNPGGPLILDTDLRAVEIADAQLRTREATITINSLIDGMALGTEANGARHAFEADASGHPPDAATAAARPLPDALAALVGDDPDFAVKADGELRAYLGEIHDASSAPCFIIVQAIRQVRGRYVPRAPLVPLRPEAEHRYLAWRGTEMHPAQLVREGRINGVRLPIRFVPGLCN